jgi:RNAse (barnase) inhibitor barstar
MSRVQLVEIDLRAISSAEELHSLLMESLTFPGWYGANWDAFWDAITGLVEMPYTVRFLGWAQFSQRLPREAVLLKECLNEMQNEYPQFASKVVYA